MAVLAEVARDPWYFIVVRERQTIDKITAVLS